MEQALLLLDITQKISELEQQKDAVVSLRRHMDLATPVTLELFNTLFPDAELVTLPTFMIALGYTRGTFFMYEQVPNTLACRFYNVLPYWMDVIHPHIRKSHYYIVLNLSDGYGERMCPPKEPVTFYRASYGQFTGAKELAESDPHRYPLLHAKKYVLCFTKRKQDPYSVPMADWYTIRGITRANIQEARANPTPWERKQARCVWRGNLDNGDVEVEGCDRNMRREFVRLHQLGLLPLADYPDSDISIRDQIQYKYLLDINGWTTTWDAFPWKMASGSVVLKVEGDWEQWYYKYLKPGVHYVPVKRDLSDLNEVIQWCLEHDEKCKQIAAAAAAFVEEFILSDRVVHDTLRAVLEFV